LAKYKHNTEEEIRSLLLKKAERMKSDMKNIEGFEKLISEDDISVLLNELNVYQFELEMQNDELKVSYDSLEAEREKFTDLYEFAPVGYFILDHLGIIEEVNQTGVNLFGYSKAVLQNKRFQSFISPNDLEKFYSFLHKMQESNQKISTEVKITLANEYTFYTRIEGILIPSFIKSNIKYYITVIDITESRNAEQQLKETKERLEMILKASSTGIWSIEFESNRMLLDEYSYKVLELQPWEFNGFLKDFFLLIHPEDRSRVSYSYKYCLNNSTEIDIEFRIVLKDGTVKDISTKGQKIIVSEDYQLFAGIITDITERKRLAKEAEGLKVEKQKAILTATLDAQEKERFKISRALHDSVCQLLYGIRLNMQSMEYYKKNKGDFENINQLLDQAIKETREISYELTPSVLKDFGFTAGIKEMAHRLSNADFLIKTNIKQSVDKVHPTIQLYAFRIIQELINNCIKHAHASVAEIIVCQQEDLITIIVSDNGEGFKFDLANALRKGSGLRGIKNQIFLLNGDINFKINSKGTTITVTFNKNIDLSV